MKQAFKIVFLILFGFSAVLNHASGQVKYSISYSDLLKASELFKDSLVKYKVVEDYDVNPVPAGGPSGYMNYLKDNLKYHCVLTDSDITAPSRINIYVLLDSLGNVIEAKRKNNIGYGYDEVAERLIKKMPRWKPALKNGVPVNCLYIIPIVICIR
jgi:hypothetical protein